MDDRKEITDNLTDRLIELVNQISELKKIDDGEQFANALITLNGKLLSMMIKTNESYEKCCSLLEEMVMNKIIKIKLQNKLDDNLKKLIKELKKEYQGSLDGIYDLYDSLYVQGEIETHSKAMGHYIAYSLSERNVTFSINEEVRKI